MSERIIVTLTIEAADFPQGVKELIAMDLERRWNGKVHVVDVKRSEWEQATMWDKPSQQGWREHYRRAMETAQ